MQLTYIDSRVFCSNHGVSCALYVHSILNKDSGPYTQKTNESEVRPGLKETSYTKKDIFLCISMSYF